ncbi:MAG: hypothetical protein Q9219_000755 [cf. Caloplaca sp. 3 TL-2023]
MAVALTSLTFTVEDGKDSTNIYVREGQVNVPDLSCYYRDKTQQKCPSEVTTQASAHIYGEMSLAAEVGSYRDISDVLRSTNDYQYYHREDPRQYAYRFNEYNIDDTQRRYPFFTDRTFTAESLHCSRHDELSKEGKESTTFTYGSPDGGNITIPNNFLGREGTTYIYKAFHAPAGADWFSCGDKCLKMWAYKNPWGARKSGFFYECDVSISSVSNAYATQHEIPDKTIKEALAAIALRGQYRGEKGGLNYQQQQFYADR